MKKRLKRTSVILYAVFLMMMVVSFLASTLTRYVATVDVPFNNNGTTYHSVDFSVNTVFEVKNQNELFGAINQGYSYIRISNELKNPFVITQTPKELKTDLILDLNGIEVYRHGNEPLFTISEGVRLTITDTSETQRGCLYNPTGSVALVSGGHLTVVSGKFECGPRYSEYYTYNQNILSDKSHKRTTVYDDMEKVIFQTKVGGVVTSKEMYAPIIRVYNTSYDGNVHHHGNIYFDMTPSATAPDANQLTILPDTYCYFTTNEDDSYPLMKLDAQDADWYYTYYVKRDATYSYHGTALGALEDPDDFIEVTIYGYENTIKTAEARGSSQDIHAEKNNYFAAIKMSGGVMDILNGDFFNYFGVNTTACIDMMGGQLTIKNGHFSSRIPNATSHIHHGVDAKEDDAAAFDRHDYFNDFYWSLYKTGELDDSIQLNEGARAHKGQGFCILTSGDAKIDIGNGNFFASNNTIAHMQGGDLSIGGGKFTKFHTVELTKYDHTDTAIYMHDGNLNIDQAEFSIEGDYARAVYMEDGMLNISRAKCDIYGDYTYAVYSTIPGDDKLNLTDIDFTMTARTTTGRLVGIYSAPNALGESGAVNISTTEGNTSKIHIDGNGSAGIYVKEGAVKTQGCDFDIMGTSCVGIYVLEGHVDVKGGSLTLKSDIGCYGIYALSTDESKPVTVKLESADINVGYDMSLDAPPDTIFDDNNGAGMAASVGVYMASANNDSYFDFINSSIYSYELGIVLHGGNLNVSDTDQNVNYIKTYRASAIAIFNGNLTFDENCNYEIVSYNTTSEADANTYQLTIPQLSYTDGVYSISPVFYPNKDGVYVEGGSLLVHGGLNLTHTGLQNVVYVKNEDGDLELAYNNYAGYVVQSYAVRVVGGNVEILKGTITANVGGGVYCSKLEGSTDTGKITLGNPSTKREDIKVSTLGDDYVGGDVYLHALGDFNLGTTGWETRYSITGGHAIELNGGDITVYNGIYDAKYSNGVLAKGSGIIKIYDGEFNGWMKDLKDKSGPSAFYGLKVLGGATVHIFYGDFDGGNGGAFITGIDRYGGRYDIGGGLANVYVYAGKFGNENTDLWDGFNVYDNANVVFGAYSEETLKERVKDFDGDYQAMIDLYGISASIAMNALTFGGSTMPSTITIYYGDYSKTYSVNGSTPHGIYLADNLHRDSKIVVYNTATSPVYTKLYSSDFNEAGIQKVGNTTHVYYPEVYDDDGNLLN